MNNSRDHILTAIKKGKENRVFNYEQPDFKAPIYTGVTLDKASCFKNELETVAGICTICNSQSEAYSELYKWLRSEEINILFCKEELIQENLLKQNINFSSSKSDFTNMQAAITTCEFLVARTGSVVVSSEGYSGRQLNFFPPIHIVIAKKFQLVNYPEDALDGLQIKYGESLPSMISFISGPSRTADIEKTLVLGAHGPKSLHVFIYE